MKAISLWQPWATLMVVGSKRLETRGWKPAYGYIGRQVVIHAAKTHEEDDYLYDDRFIAALKGESVHYGCILGVGKLVAAVGTDHIGPDLYDLDEDRGGWCERDLGNYADGRFAWLFRDMRKFAEPVPWKGSQGFFDVPDEVVREALGETLNREAFA